MRKHKIRKLFAPLCTAALSAGLFVPVQTSQLFAYDKEAVKNEIWFDRPVSEGGLSGSNDQWQQLSLPIGNSYMGMSVYGETDKERLVFNHKSLWNGGPSESRPDYNGGNIDTASDGTPMSEYVEKVAQAFINGDASAESLARGIVGESDGYGAYQCFGDLYLDFDRKKPDSQDGWNIVDDRDERIQYSGSWSNYSQPSWNGGTEKFVYQDDASFTFTFTGTAVRMIGVRNTEMNAFDLYVDDMQTPYKENISMAGSSNERVTLFEVTNLAKGEHTIKFQNRGGNGKNKVSFDRLEYKEGTKSQIYDLNPNNSAQTGVTYSSDWAMWSRQNETDGAEWVNTDEMFSASPNASTAIDFAFTGTGLSLYGAKTTNSANVLGTLRWVLDAGTDHEQSGEVSCREGSSTLKRQELFGIKNLSEGEHTIHISSVNNTKLSLDNFVVYSGAEEDEEPEETHTPATEYRRWLSLDDALAGVSYTRDQTKYTREYLASYPDNVIAIALDAEGKKSLDFDLSFPLSNENSSATGKTGTYTTEANGTSASLLAAGSMNDNQMKFAASVQVRTDAGEIVPAEKSLQIRGAKKAEIYISAATDYKNEYPAYRTGQSDEQVAQTAENAAAAAAEQGYAAIKEAHVNDYQSLYNRVQLDLGQSLPAISTDELVKGYKNSSLKESERRYLEQELYQYGRYLMIASSRESDDLPANLQGVWNVYSGPSESVPWGSDYHMNVNLQMNYWPVYSANLAECALPMIKYEDSLREPGRVTASAYFGVDNSNGQQNGYTAHTQNTPFGWTCPGWSFDWGWSPAAVPWMLQNVYEYYEYTGDLEYLKETIFPMMQEEAKLYDQILKEVTFENGKTRLVTVPAYSPEHGPRTAGNVYENSLVWQLYNDCVEAAEAINAKYPGSVDAADIAHWKDYCERLDPIEIGTDGQIKEWFDETTLSMGERGHRHMSHLLGLFPGDLITVDNEEWINAAKVSLLDRTDRATGWGIAQRLNSWARVQDGEHCMQVIETMLNTSIYANLWDAHPPFQIDGNFGYTSGLNEMFMQSNTGLIQLLPALPAKWSEGSVSGLLARGNFEVSQSWKDGSLQTVSITSNNGGTCRLQNAAIANSRVIDEEGREVKALLDEEHADTVVFETKPGKTYTLEAGDDRQDPEVIDTTLLETAIKEADGIETSPDEALFEAAGWKRFEAQAQAARKTLLEAKTQSEVDEGAKALNQAMLALRCKVSADRLNELQVQN